MTEPARGVSREVHDRMPLTFDEESLASWLSPDLAEKETIRHIVHHVKADSIVHWPVSTQVNRPSGPGDKALINPL
ncbi:SOS response-associated peptidase [Halomonas sp. FL8]|nr:SOS response-associated peptidase [Halomonas sp. FL8]MCP1362439.1 SOS response-associated peptidase [Halomonas sp. BBD45]MCP1364097.1 SOS response-associated peptidase [Halomonas sp. BBD48]